MSYAKCIKNIKIDYRIVLIDKNKTAVYDNGTTEVNVYANDY